MVDHQPSVSRRNGERTWSQTASLGLATLATLALSLGTAGAADWQLFGFTTGVTTGDAGITGMNRLCSTEYPGSRLCTTDEIVGTIDPRLETLRRFAWVHSDLTIGLSSTNTVYDSLGKAISLGNGHTPNCEGWSYSSTWAVTITTDSGSALVKPCSVARPLACCMDATTILFRDGYEDGTTDAWASVSP